jgi:hypothetical protein
MHNLKKLLLTASLLLIPPAVNLYSQEHESEPKPDSLKTYPLKNGFPTTAGIDSCVRDYEESVILDFEKFFKVSVNSMYFETDNLRDYCINNTEDNEIIATMIPIASGDELGIYYSGQDYAVISNDEKYIGYDLKDVKKRKLWGIKESNKFVKSVMIHEIGHDYTSQIITELRFEKIKVSPEYLSSFAGTNGSRFIEEGIAEYCPTAMKELIPGPEYIPKSLEDLTKNYYMFNYKYAELYIRDFLNEKGLREGIRMIVINSPPTDEELLNPEQYFSRLKTIRDIKGE